MATTMEVPTTEALQPSSPIDDLDQELEAVFDAPPSPESQPPEPAELNASPEHEPPAPADTPSEVPVPPRRSIVDALMANTERLTGRAAALAAAVAAETEAGGRSGFAAPPRLPIAEAMMQRRLSKNALSAAEEKREEEKRRRRARNAFRVIGRERLGKEQERRKTYEYIDSNFTNMALREAVHPQEAMQALFEHFVRVDISEITTKDDEMRAGKLGEFVVFGCLVKKHAKKEAKNGQKYAVWSMCNMPRGTLPGTSTILKPTVVTVLLFEAAFELFHREVEGSVFALRKPSLLPPRGSETGASDVRKGAEFSGHCLRVGKEQQIIRLGVSKDFKLCNAPGPNLSVCGSWFDANRMQQCAHHTRARRKRFMTGARMDVNNAERPSIPKTVMRGAQDPNNISKVAGGFGQDEEQRDEEDDKYLKEKLKKDRKTLTKLRMSKKVNRDVNALPKPGQPKSNGAARNRIIGTTSRKVTRKAPPNVGRFQRIVKQESIQKRYTHAIDFLLKCGYSLDYDGSLLPPDEKKLEGLQLTLRRKKVYNSTRKQAGGEGRESAVDVALKNLKAADRKQASTNSEAVSDIHGKQSHTPAVDLGLREQPEKSLDAAGKGDMGSSEPAVVDVKGKISGEPDTEPADTTPADENGDVMDDVRLEATEDTPLVNSGTGDDLAAATTNRAGNDSTACAQSEGAGSGNVGGEPSDQDAEMLELSDESDED